MSEPAGLRHEYAHLNGIRLHWVEAGSGEPVVLLHGFPDFWWSWRHQLEPLAAAGLRVVAPDLRGYNESEAPVARSAYAPRVIAADVAALIAHACNGRAAVVGHDWGGVTAWRLAMRQPELLTRLVAINAPHPAAFRRALLTSRQLARSWYVFVAQLPWLPERLLSADGAALLGRFYEAEARRTGAFDDEDVARYRALFGSAAALRGPLHYYRNAIRLLPGSRRRRGGSGDAELTGAAAAATGRGGSTDQRVDVPTLVIWGERDRALDPSLIERLDRYARDVRVARLARSGHWPHRDAADIVNRLILEFVR
jgi:epoxide hydrolase 4